ncbi:hypothetical protein O9992_16350 [Vibrio lentus]|nr:hypothetical protein [Vibrio lentus]
MLFEESVRGLRKGAPVEYRVSGLQWWIRSRYRLVWIKMAKVSNQIPILIKLEIEQKPEVFKAIERG